MLVLISNSVMSAQLDDIKWFVEVLIGITIAVIGAAGFASWKISDIEIKNIEKYLQDRINDQYEQLNSKIDLLTSVTDESISGGLVSVNGWMPKAKNDVSLRHIKLANTDFYELKAKLVNENVTPFVPFMVIPNNIGIEEGYYTGYDEITNQLVIFAIQQNNAVLVTRLTGKASLQIKLTGYLIKKN